MTKCKTKAKIIELVYAQNIVNRKHVTCPDMVEMSNSVSCIKTKIVLKILKKKKFTQEL